MKRNALSVFCCSAVVASLSGLSQTSPAQKDLANPLGLSAHHATISVANMEAESLWYQRVLGFHETTHTQRGPDRYVDHLLIPGYRLDLITQTGSARHQVLPDGQEQGWFNIVFGTASIEAAYKHLVAEGISVRVDRDKNSAIEHLTFHDPEGNEIGIAAL